MGNVTFFFIEIQGRSCLLRKLGDGSLNLLWIFLNPNATFTARNVDIAYLLRIVEKQTEAVHQMCLDLDRLHSQQSDTLRAKVGCCV